MTKRSTLVAAVSAAVLLGTTGVELGGDPPEIAGDAGHLEALLNPVDIGRQLCSNATNDGSPG